MDISPMSYSDALELQRCYRSEAASYRKFFTPMSGLSELAEAVSIAKRDRYWILKVNSQAAGLCFMRGLDEGYQRPSFGVYIRSKFSGQGLASKALAHSLDWARYNGVRKVFLKVHGENESARHIYQNAGFEMIGHCADTGQHIMEATLEA